MGIKGFRKHCEKYAPGSTGIKINSRVFSGKRVAIDGSNLMCRLMSRAKSKTPNSEIESTGYLNQDTVMKAWLKEIATTLLDFLKCGIVPVFVVDGKPPKSKDETKKARVSKFESTRRKIENISSRIVDADDIDANDLLKLKKENLGLVTPTLTEVDECLKLIESLGLPYIKSNTDGEKLCASLCKIGKVAAVYSTDTDTIIFGAPIVITAISPYPIPGESYSRQFTCDRLDMILDGLGFNMRELVDFAIMTGCDYNKNIKGVGIDKSYKIIREYHNIEAAARYLTSDAPRPATLGIKTKFVKEDFDILNHRECRSIFEHTESENLALTPVLLEIDTCKCDMDYLAIHTLSGLLHQFTYLYSEMTGEEGHPESLELRQIAPYRRSNIIIKS